ncbi:MAG: hypothetical protein H6742_03850 [Alphaproteobacteria bacterium]|nr:hypothetical protein [Alphaproteobacteria bacterium]
MGTPPRLLLLALPLAAACGEKDAADDSGSSGDGGHGGYVNSCPPYHVSGPVGTTWQFLVWNGAIATWEVTASNESEPLDFEITETAPGESVIVRQLRCDADGVWLLGWQAVYDAGFDSSFELDAPALVLPAGIAVGTTWTTEAVGAYESSLFGSEQIEEISIWEVVGEAEREVDAGVFTALEVHGYYTSLPDQQYIQWLAEDGLVDDGTKERMGEP